MGASLKHLQDKTFYLRTRVYDDEAKVAKAIEERKRIWGKDRVYQSMRTLFSVYRSRLTPSIYVFVTDNLPEAIAKCMGLAPYQINIMPYYPADT